MVQRGGLGAKYLIPRTEIFLQRRNTKFYYEDTLKNTKMYA